ncbi:hypothetical protein [Streptomyces sp. NPDC004599]
MGGGDQGGVANLEQPVSVGDPASLVSSSRFHFVRCFKAATGFTPYRYLTELRIDLARKSRPATTPSPV